MFVKQSLPGGWLYVVVVDGQLRGSTGYVFGKDPEGKHDYVNVNMPPDPAQPDAGAELHTVQSLEQAHVFVRKHYGAATQEKGQDERFFANVLLHVNQAAKRTGVYTRTVVRQKKMGGMTVPMPVEETWLRAGSEIWVPSLDFALSLKGQVSAGSWLRDKWESIKGFAEKAAAVAAFIAGIAVGAVEAVKDLVVGTLEFIWDTLKSLGGNLIDAATSIYGLITDPLKRRVFLEVLDDQIRPMWEAESFLRRWYNRGWLIAYATVQVVLMFVLPEVAAVLRASKIGQVAARLINVLGSTKVGEAIVVTSKAAKAKIAAVASKGGKVIEAVKGSKVGQTVTAAGKVVVESKPVRILSKAGKRASEYAEKVLGLPRRVIEMIAEQGLLQLEKLSPKAAAASSARGRSRASSSSRERPSTCVPC